MRLALTTLVVLGGGCFALSDTGRFVPDEDCDLQLRLRNFSAHTDDLFVVRLLQDPPDDGTPFLQAVAIFEPLESTTLNLRMPNSVAALVTADRPHPFIDFFGDDDSIPFQSEGDHAWRHEDACVSGPELFQHDIDFDEIAREILPRNTGVEVALCDVPRGAPIEVRVYGDVSADGVVEQRRALGLYRFTQNTRGDTTTFLRFPGIIDTGFDHFIDVYIDQDGNGAHDNNEPAWSFTFDRQPDAISCDLNGILPGGTFDPCANIRLADLPGMRLDRFPACLDAGMDPVPARVRVTLGTLGDDNRLPAGRQVTNLNPEGPNSWLNFDPADVANPE